MLDPQRAKGPDVDSESASVKNFFWLPLVASHVVARCEGLSFSFHVVSEISVSMHLGFMPHVSCEQLHNITFLMKASLSRKRDVLR